MDHIIIGQTGEYSDHSEWVVAVYASALAAERHVRALNKWTADHGLDAASRPRSRTLVECPLDPYFQCDYTGTSYTRESRPSSTRYAAAIRKVLGS